MEEIAKSLHVEYKTLTNMAEGGQTAIRLEIENRGLNHIPGWGFSCYFCHDNFLFPEIYSPNEAAYITRRFGSGVFLPKDIQLEFERGCMYKLTPKLMMPLLIPNETMEIFLVSAPSSVSRYDSFPNWYCANNTHSAVIENTRNSLSFVQKHDTDQNQLRFPFDLLSVPLEAQDRYFDVVNTPKTPKQCATTIIPTAEKNIPGAGAILIDSTWAIEFKVPEVAGRAGLLERKLFFCPDSLVQLLILE